jgi:glycosyltransferase involved in cell wall biosynthesis
MKFKIVIPTYNTENWIQRCVISILNQTFKDFECVIINDSSTDSTRQKIEELKQYLDNRFKIVHNSKNVKALQNIVDGFNLLNCKDDPESILMVIDGDDFLYSEWSLDIVRQAYEQTNCLLSYGNWIGWPDGSSSNCRPIHPDIHKNRNYRGLPFAFSHLRTWKSKLWYNINDKDLRDEKGNYYESGWDVSFMLPMIEMAGERTLFIPNVLYCYNRINPISDDKIKQSQQIQFDNEIRKKQKYSIFEELKDYSNASGLLNKNRFDIAAKTMYTNSYIKNLNVNFYKDLYLEHLKVWNNFYEQNPIKNSKEEFLKSFKETIDSIRKNGFNENISKIPVINNSAINGSHRIAASIVLNKNVKTIEAQPSEGQYIADYNYFKTKNNFVHGGLKEEYLDEMALEYCRRKENMYTITIFPSHNIKDEIIENIVTSKTNVVYKKEITLENNGKINYVHNLYYGENWIGNRANNFLGIREKSSLSFAKGNRIVVYLVEENNIENLLLLKAHVRKVCGVGKHSVHINDTQEETWRVASSAFNKNSIHNMNVRKNMKTPNFDNFFTIYQNLLNSRKDKELFCIDSSAVLSAYGIRDCKDLDFLHVNNIADLGKGIECHNEYSLYYLENKNEIIYNPNFHFYLFGVKFASLETVKKMKAFRNEEKDKNDLKLIKGAS